MRSASGVSIGTPLLLPDRRGILLLAGPPPIRGTRICFRRPDWTLPVLSGIVQGVLADLHILRHHLRYGLLAIGRIPITPRRLRAGKPPRCAAHQVSPAPAHRQSFLRPSRSSLKAHNRKRRPPRGDIGVRPGRHVRMHSMSCHLTAPPAISRRLPSVRCLAFDAASQAATSDMPVMPATSPGRCRQAGTGRCTTSSMTIDHEKSEIGGHLRCIDPVLS